jgi:hypothetical protein
MVLISRATLVKSKEIKPIHCKRLAKLELTTIPREYSLNADFKVEQKRNLSISSNGRRDDNGLFFAYN